MKKLGIISLALVISLGVLGGTFALFTDTETSSTAAVVAGTLNLEVGGAAATVNYSVSNAYPGQVIAPAQGFVLTNTGSLPGVLRVYLVKDADTENGMVEPETDFADIDVVGGELDNFLNVNVDGNSFGYGGTVPSMGLDTLAVGVRMDITGLIWGPNPKPLAAGERYPVAPFELWFGWAISSAATNVIQSDGLNFHLEFVLDQA